MKKKSENWGQRSQQRPLVARHYISCLPPAALPVFTIEPVMYEPEMPSQQPINQPQSNDGHSGPKPYWLKTDAVWSDGGSWEHSNHLIALLSVQTSCL